MRLVCAGSLRHAVGLLTEAANMPTDSQTDDSKQLDKKAESSRDDQLGQHLGTNLLSTRRQRKLSQSRLAELAQVPRSTISNMESGQGNPALQTLASVARALNVGIDELLSPPRATVQLVRHSELPVVQRSAGQVSITKLLPDRIRGLELDRIQIEPQSTMRGQPHVPGTKEYLHVLEGQLQVLLAGEFYSVDAGDVLAFAGDQHHSYRNAQSTRATAVSFVVPHIAG